MNAEVLTGGKNAENKPADKSKQPAAQQAPGEKGEAGRKEKPDDEKSAKTIANRESMS